MIDTDIMGIEKPWYETKQDEKYAVSYGDSWYKREDHWATGEDDRAARFAFCKPTAYSLR